MLIDNYLYVVQLFVISCCSLGIRGVIFLRLHRSIGFVSDQSKELEDQKTEVSVNLPLHTGQTFGDMQIADWNVTQVEVLNFVRGRMS